VPSPPGPALGIFLSLSLGIFPQPLGGQEWEEGLPDERLTLEECVAIAMEESPLILAGEGQYEAALARVRQATALPQPSLDLDSDLQPGLTEFSRYGERYLGISQTIPFPGRTWLQGRIAREEANEVLAEVELLRQDVAFQVKEAFFGSLLAQERSEYARQNLEFAQAFLEMTELKFDAGDVARVDVVRARVEAATAANGIRRAENEVRLARAALNFLMGRMASSPLEVQGQLRSPLGSYDLEQMTAWALESRPEIQRVQFAIQRENLTKSRGVLSYFPDFDVGAAKHRIVGEGESWDVTLSLSLPLFFWQPARGEIAEANANLRSLREEASHLANAVSREVEEAYVNLTAAADQIRLFEEEILSQAEEAYALYELSYEQGEIGGIDLIEARRTLNEARTSYADALFNHDVARAAIERSIGRPLEEQDDGLDQTDSERGDSRALDPGSWGLRRRLRAGHRFRGGGGV
jgi:outer membrane protein TolC